MRLFLISDNTDTQMGLRLSGIPGVVVHGRDELVAAMEKAMSDPDVCVVLVTEKLVGIAKQYIYAIKARGGLPLIVEIPDRHSDGKRNNISSYIHEALGIKF